MTWSKEREHKEGRRCCPETVRQRRSRKGETQMKKNMRQFSAICLISLLSVSAILPAFAEETDRKAHGWQQEDDRWIYLDSSGERKTDTWILGKDRNHYYLDEEGCMAVSTVIHDGDNVYYVDETGRRRANCWASESNWNEEVCDQEVDTVWYYFGANGKAKNTEGKALRLKNASGEERKYFFDSDGHMLTGWQKIYKPGDPDSFEIYYLGDENEGHVHTQWQYLIPPEDEEILANPDKAYDGYEMFYFGWDGKMKRSDESKVENKQQFAFDENGVMMTGWAPAISPDNPAAEKGIGVNRYYDKITGIMATGWLYTTDPDSDDGSDPHWFYCDLKDGYLYNEGSKDSDAVLGWKKIDGNVYFFDDYGHMVTGLISTGEEDVSGSPFAESEYDFQGAGVIGKGGSARPAGIYYLSQKEETLGQMQKGKKIRLSLDGESATYYFGNAGWAYTNALVDSSIYGADGAMIKSDSGWELFSMEDDIYAKSDVGEEDGQVTSREHATPLIPRGSLVAVSSSGKVKKSGTIKADGVRYIISNYIATENPEDEK